jgi:hypothetical protein
MKKNYKLQNTNYKQITNYNVQKYKQRGKEESKIMNSKGGHGFHQGSSLMGTMTTFNKKFLQGPGTVFSKRVPGRRRQKNEYIY